MYNIQSDYEGGRDELTAIIAALKEAKIIVSTLKSSGFLQFND